MNIDGKNCNQRQTSTSLRRTKNVDDETS
jgi:hypothetical protein